MRATRSALVLLLAVLSCGACDGGPRAAEPARSPALTTAPAGVTVTAGEQAEGIVADPVTRLVAVGVRNPDGLAVLDGRTGALTARVPLPGHLRHLDLAGPGGPVLVADEDSGSLLSVGLPDARIRLRIPVGRYPHAATVTADGTLAVADELGGAFVLVRDAQVVHRFTDVTQPGGVAAAGTLVGVIDVRERTLGLYDTVAQVRVARVPAGAGPTHLVADRRGHLLVVDTRADRLLTFEVTPRLRQIRSTALAGTPYGIAYDSVRDRVWVTLTERNQVVGLDLAAGAPAVVASFPTVRQPNTVAVDSTTGRVFVASRTDGLVQLVDPAS